MVVIITDVAFAVDCMIDIVEVVALVVVVAFVNVVMVAIDGDVTGYFDVVMAVAMIVVGWES